MLKNSLLLLFTAIVYTLILLYFSLADTQGVVPETGIKFQDKILHFGSYIALAVIWGLFARALNKKYVLFYTFLATLFFGIVLELVQETINPLRTYDIYDLLANCTGVVVGTIFVVIYSNKLKLK